MFTGSQDLLVLPVQEAHVENHCSVQILAVIIIISNVWGSTRQIHKYWEKEGKTEVYSSSTYRILPFWPPNVRVGGRGAWGEGVSPTRSNSPSLHRHQVPQNLTQLRSLVGYSPWGRKESDPTEWRTHTDTIYLELPSQSAHYRLSPTRLFPPAPPNLKHQWEAWVITCAPEERAINSIPPSPSQVQFIC